MYLRLEIVDIKLIGGRADISFCIPIRPCDPIQIRNKHVMPDIKFPVVVQHWPIDIHLHYIGILWIISFPLIVADIFTLFNFVFPCVFPNPTNNIVELVDLVNDRDSPSLVWILSRFNYPYISGFFVLHILFLFFNFLLFFYYRFSSIIVSDESFVLWILHPLFYMES